MLRYSALLFAPLLFLPVQAGAAAFQNGSFELPGGGPIRQQLVDGDTFVTGWVNAVNSNNGFDIYESGGEDVIPAGAGNYYVSFGHDGTTGGTLSQTFDTVIGQKYSVNYLLTVQQSTGDEAVDVAVLSGNTVFASVDKTFDYTTWTAGPTLSFTATSGETTLRFTDTTSLADSGPLNWGLDAVTVTPIRLTSAPEPGSLALLSGAALLFATHRRFLRRGVH